MTLSAEQLHTLITTALPGEQIERISPLPGDRYAIALASGDRVDVQTYAGIGQAATAAAALRRLRGEIDLAVPMLRASDATGELVGVPYIVHSALEGEPLSEVLSSIPDGALYELGRALGQAVYRVHRLACERYGPLAQNGPGASTEREYVLLRIDERLGAARESGLLTDHQANELRIHFDQQFAPTSSHAALVIGSLTAERILVRSTSERWAIGGLTGWDQALGWSPLWDHIRLLESARAPEFFALRVGYGNGYDEQTSRTYEQVREAALRPYRELLALEQALAAQANGDRGEQRRNMQVLLGLTSLARRSEIPPMPDSA
jgi:hypothetical protein